MSNEEVTSLSKKDLAIQGTRLNLTPMTNEVPAADEAPNQKPTLQELLPPGYPQLLVHGTSPENAVTISTQGLALGTSTTNVTDSLNNRFYRGDAGRLVIMQYQEDHFRTNTQPNEFSPFVFFQIKRKSMTPVQVQYNDVDTDLVAGSGHAQSYECIPPEELCIVSVNPEQVRFSKRERGFSSK